MSLYATDDGSFFASLRSPLVRGDMGRL